MIAAELGVQLDKRLQCSSWGLRPLSPGQVLHLLACCVAVVCSWLDSLTGCCGCLPVHAQAGREGAERPAIFPLQQHLLTCAG